MFSDLINVLLKEKGSPASASSPNICLAMPRGEECGGSFLANVFMTVMIIIMFMQPTLAKNKSVCV